MPVIIDEVTADIAPPPAASPVASPGPAASPVRPDPDQLRRELTRTAERAERLRAT